MKGSDFIFDYVHLLYCKCHKINLNRGGSYIDSLDWITNEKATINPVNDDHKCFQYAATTTINHEEIGKHPQIISKIKAFINKYSWKGINSQSGKDDWKTFGKSNPTITLNVSYVKK